MAIGHEKLDVYRLAIGYLAWVFEHPGKKLDRMAAMLSRLGKCCYSVQEESPARGIDFDSDFDPDDKNSHKPALGNLLPATVVEPEGGDKPQPEAEGRSR